MNPPNGTWRSPFTHRDLGAEELIQEIALNVVAKLHLIALVSDETANIIQGPDSVAVHAPGLNYVGIIPMPSELHVYLQTHWMHWLVLGMDNYGISGAATSAILPPLVPSGEKLGRLFRRFSVFDQLCRLTVTKPWPSDRILGIHGAEDPQMIRRLRDAGILFILVWREEHLNALAAAGREPSNEDMQDCVGSGCMRHIAMGEAETLALDAYAGKSESTRQIFRLNHPYCVDSWSSNHPRFA